MRTPLTEECMRGPGCPPDIDLRNCPKFPNNCPLVHVHGSEIVIGDPQQKLF